VEARIVGQLGMEGGGEHGSFADRHRVPLPGGEHLDLRPGPLDPGRPDEDRAERLLAGPGHLEIGLEALQLPAEGVATGRHVDEAEMLGVADDQPGAGTEDRLAGLVVGAQPGLQARRRDQFGDRRRLAARDDQAVEPRQPLRRTYLDRLRAKPAQRLGVRLEVALQS
jgi:hypothetical protein